jgi:peptidyl-prolyl cis-trans isomerase B (cyclophilin B)
MTVYFLMNVWRVFVMKRIALVIVFIISSLAVVSAFAQDDETVTPRTPEAICESATPQEPTTRTYSAAPEHVLEDGVDYYALLCTAYGPIYINLFENLTPKTVNNMVYLADNGYFNNLTFHRVIDDFMIQGGDPEGTGRGGPGYQFEDEFVSFLTFDRPGLLAMANSGANTNGSQFFVTTVVTDWLTYNHTIFGEVIYGQENADAIPATEVEPNVALDTIIIITDPTTVDVEYPEVSATTSEDLNALFAEFPPISVLVADEARSGQFDAETFPATLDSFVADDVSALLSDYNYQYTVSNYQLNETCDLEAFPLEYLNYQIHAFENSADVRQVVLDERFTTLLNNGNDSQAIKMEYSSLNGQTWTTTGECAEEVTVATIYRPLGRFITVAQIAYPSDSEFDEQVLDGIFIDLDTLFIDLYRAETSH